MLGIVIVAIPTVGIGGIPMVSIGAIPIVKLSYTDSRVRTIPTVGMY